MEQNKVDKIVCQRSFLDLARDLGVRCAVTYKLADRKYIKSMEVLDNDPKMQERRVEEEKERFREELNLKKEKQDKKVEEEKQKFREQGNTKGNN